MGIDGIGNGGRIPPGGVGGNAPTTGPTAPKEAGKTFEVRPASGEKTAESQAARETQATERSPLERLRAGEIDVNGYVDLKVDAATKNLHGLSSHELGQIRSVLKSQMANDPAVMDLVKQATGALPKPEGE